MPPSADLPAWLRHSGGGASGRRGGGRSRGPALAALALLLLAAGGGAGYLLARRRAVPPVTTAPAVCPPAVACVAPPASSGGGGSIGASRVVRHGKAGRAAPAALMPLPAGKPMEEGERTKALRAFAAERAPELRECLDDPDRGPPLELGAAFEIGANGAVELVQILGADGAPREVRHCYSSHLKKWRFPTELLRGEEKLLVNFVL
ncbi:MAG TPA: hypothetical protein VLA79_08750 [Polyangia bacterium]|nr:hypothetical protein [Polyangia bacterium]